MAFTREGAAMVMAAGAFWAGWSASAAIRCAPEGWLTVCTNPSARTMPTAVVPSFAASFGPATLAFTVTFTENSRPRGTGFGGVTRSSSPERAQVALRPSIVTERTDVPVRSRLKREREWVARPRNVVVAV